MKKSAFTLIELVFIIVVLGIITAVSVSRVDRDHRQDASTQILQDIRYTQHLALMDDKTDPFNASWQGSLWTIRFFNANNAWTYTIGSDADNGGNIGLAEAAIDPTNGNSLFDNNGVQAFGESSRIFLTQNFGITNIAFNNTATGAAGNSGVQHVAFDYMGRPHRGILANGGGNDYATIMQADLNITFTMADGVTTFSIIVEDQTGAAYIDGQDDS